MPSTHAPLPLVDQHLLELSLLPSQQALPCPRSIVLASDVFMASPTPQRYPSKPKIWVKRPLYNGKINDFTSRLGKDILKSFLNRCLYEALALHPLAFPMDSLTYLLNSS